MPYTVVQFDPACIITVSRSLYTPPPTTCTHSDIPSSLPVGREGVDGGGGEVGVAFESFTQPSRYDELVISTQVPCTPGATETPVQRLTLRLTRFYTASPCQKVWARLQQVMKKFSYDVRISPDKVSSVAFTYSVDYCVIVHNTVPQVTITLICSFV
jgi:hypothetical protein